MDPIKINTFDLAKEYVILLEENKQLLAKEYVTLLEENKQLQEEIAFLKEQELEKEETVYQRGYVDGVADGYEEAKKRMTHERNN